MYIWISASCKTIWKEVQYSSQKAGVEPTLVDPGLLLKKRENKSPDLYIAQHIDDSLTVGKLEDIKKLQEHMNKKV